MKLKVCGITRLAQLEALDQMGVNYAGMIFYEGSSRYAPPHLEKDLQLLKALPIQKVGVFVNADFDVVCKTVEDYGLHAVQLHGDETDEYCLELNGRAKVMKAIRVEEGMDINSMVNIYERVCDYLLFDTQTPHYGGSGKQFNWALLQEANIAKPFFLSGGIGLADEEKLKAFKHPHWYAVDVNSRFETEPGVKDLAQVAQFQKNLATWTK